MEGRLFFGNAERVLDLVAPLVQTAQARVVVLDCTAIFDVEYSAMKMLAEAEQRARRLGGQLWLAGLNPSVKSAVRRSPLGSALGADRTFDDLNEAVEAFCSRPADPVQNTSPAPQ